MGRSGKENVLGRKGRGRMREEGREETEEKMNGRKDRRNN